MKGKKHETSTAYCSFKWLCYLAIFLAAVLCYSNSLFGDLVHDDLFAIQSNRDVRPESSLSGIFYNDFWGKDLADNTSHKSYRPLCILSFRLNYFLHGLNPFGYHLVNLSLHLIVTMVFTYLCENLIFLHWHGGVLAGLLFAVHPIHTEAVTGVVGRADVLSCLLSLFSFLSYTRICALDGEKKGKTKLLLLLLSILFGAMGMLAKEHGVTVFGICIIYDFFVVTPSIRRFFKEKEKEKSYFFHQLKPAVIRICILITVILALLLFRISMLHGHLPKFTEEDNPAAFSESYTTKVLTYLHLASFNLQLLCAPLVQSYDWQIGSIPLIETFSDVRNIVTLGSFGLLILTVVHFVRNIEDPQQKPIVIGLCFLIIPFLPASNLFVTVGFVVAERILYIPSLGYCILISHGLCLLVHSVSCSGHFVSATDDNNNNEKQESSARDTQRASVHYLTMESFRAKYVMGIFMFSVLTFALKTYRRNEIWKSRESLFRSGVEALPHNAKAHYNYGNYLKDAGKTKEAIKHYQLSVSLYPAFAKAHNNLATVIKDDELAEKHLRLAIKYEPYHYRAMYNLANIHRRRKENSEAKQLFERCISLSPKFTDAKIAYAGILQEEKAFLQAESLLRQIVNENPSNAEAYNNLGVLLADVGKHEESINAYKRSLHLKQNNSIVLLNIGRQYRMMGLEKEAEEALRRSIAVKENPSAYEALGILFHQTNRLTQARNAFQKAVEFGGGKIDLVKNLAITLFEIGDKEKAITLIEKTCERRKCPISLIYVLLNFMLDANIYEKIIESVDNFLKDYPIESELHVVKGHAYREMKDLETAIKCYKDALHLQPQHFRAHSSLASVYHLQKKYELALDQYRIALQLNPEDQLLLENMAKLKRAARWTN